LIYEVNCLTLYDAVQLNKNENIHEFLPLGYPVFPSKINKRTIQYEDIRPWEFDIEGDISDPLDSSQQAIE